MNLKPFRRTIPAVMSSVQSKKRFFLTKPNDQLLLESSDAAYHVELILESGVVLELAGTIEYNHDYTIVDVSVGGLALLKRRRK